MSKIDISEYDGPAGGWGSAQSLMTYLGREHSPTRALPVLRVQNKPQGMSCVSCAWAKPGDPHIFEFCENGAKATIWETTEKKADAGFFARHTLTTLRTWTDHALEAEGRLTEPLRRNPATDTYEPVGWDEAIADIAQHLQDLPRSSTVFYASGRASLETSYMYGLLARVYGNNNLPDSSNMCHESTSVALPKSIGVPVGTVLLDDFAHTECILFFGQNTGSNSPRLLHDLQEARKRNVPIITFNPLRERGLERFKNPQSVMDMSGLSETQISTQYLQVKTGGDLGAIAGLCKAIIEGDDLAQQQGTARWLDTEFIAQHTEGADAFIACVRDYTWAEIEAASGLSRDALTAAAHTYAHASRAIAVYGMGLTQHKKGVDNVRMLVNLLLLRGQIGLPGSGICPVRGHSNVQGQRTVGITEKPELVPMDKLRELYHFEPPAERGLNTVETCQGVIDGKVQAVISLGGNFLRAVPETDAMERAWPRLKLSVNIATKLNRTHIVPGEVTYLLPCLGRSEIDEQGTGRQAVSIEDSTTCIHGSNGMIAPASDQLRSETWIVGKLAQASVGDDAQIPWQAWIDDYARVRDAIERTYPDQFESFNARMWQPGGFARPVAARQRKWQTESGLAQFFQPTTLTACLPDSDPAHPALQLMTVRSNDQFNTTVYGYDDRFRGISGTRMVVMMNLSDMTRLGLTDGQEVSVETIAPDNVQRVVAGLRVVAYDIPAGCCAAYYPECNPLMPLWHHAEESFVPAAKSIPVRIRPQAPRTNANNASSSANVLK